MSEPCQQEANIAVITQRLKSGDTILEKLEKQMDNLVANVAELLHCVKGEEGLITKQKEHGVVINDIKSQKIIDKVDKHEQRYIVQSWAVGFFGLTSIATIVGLMYMFHRLGELIK